MVVHFYTPYDQTVDRWQTSPTNQLTAISLQAIGSHKEATPTYIYIYRKDVVNKKLGKNVIFFHKITQKSILMIGQ